MKIDKSTKLSRCSEVAVKKELNNHQALHYMVENYQLLEDLVYYHSIIMSWLWHNGMYKFTPADGSRNNARAWSGRGFTRALKVPFKGTLMVPAKVPLKASLSPPLKVTLKVHTKVPLKAPLLVSVKAFPVASLSSLLTPLGPREALNPPLPCPLLRSLVGNPPPPRHLRCLESPFAVRNDSNRHRLATIWKSHDSNRKAKNRSNRC